MVRLVPSYPDMSDVHRKRTIICRLIFASSQEKEWRHWSFPYLAADFLRLTVRLLQLLSVDEEGLKTLWLTQPTPITFLDYTKRMVSTGANVTGYESYRPHIRIFTPNQDIFLNLAISYPRLFTIYILSWYVYSKSTKCWPKLSPRIFKVESYHNCNAQWPQLYEPCIFKSAAASVKTWHVPADM